MRGASLVLLLLLAGCFGGNEPADDDVPTESGAWGWPAMGEPLADPLAPGNLTFTTEDYALGNTTVGGPDAAHEGYEYEALIRGVITVPHGPGPYPLAVFLHGQHSPCSGPDGREGSDCDVPYRNDLGYLYLMEHLASHGIATASVLAFEINRNNGNPDIGMWARGELILATIDALEASPYASTLDFDRIGLMGHSRGGEGVVTAVEVNNGRADPHNLSSVIALAPTDFAYRSVPDVPFLTLAPYCDGDVYNLHGLRQFDQSRYTDSKAVKIQILVMGANHNNYNTQWGRGWSDAITSDGDDAAFGSHQNTHCDLRREDGGGRLSLEETYAEAILHMGGFLRWTLLDDAGLASYFLGAPQPANACPGRTSCPGAVHLSTMTPARRDVFSVDANGLVAAEGVTLPDGEWTVCQMASCAENVYSSAWMADMRFADPRIAAPLPNELRLAFETPADLRETPVLNVRVAVTTDKDVNALGKPTMSVTFESEGAVVTVPVDHPALFVPPALPADPGVGALGLISVGGSKVSANAVSVPIPDGVDAGNLTAVSFSFGPAAGVDRILVADAWFNRETSAARVA